VAQLRACSSLDLQSVEQSQRGTVWRQATSKLFPGLTVHAVQPDPSQGSIHGSEFGPGQLWRILSPPLRADYDPTLEGALAKSFSVMLQLQGSTIVSQKQRACMLRPQDICVIDGVAPFHMEVNDGYSQIMFLRMPRSLVVNRHPYLEQRTAQCFDSDDPGVRVLRSVLLGLLDSAAFLEQEQCTTALVGAAYLIGVPKPPSSSLDCEVNWRARAALAYIDASLADPRLNAAQVAAAQSISRRRLDEILLKTVGTSLNAQIWLRRLAQAATDLQDPRQASRTVTEIAFAVGFVDAAHFTRAFRRRYGCTPREWRMRN
jgi:AraC family transcriptional activator of tynA and feaB